MNKHNPLVPQGSLLDQKNKGRTRVEIAVFVVLAIHGIGLLALLMQGCQKPPESTLATEATNSPPPFVEPTNPPSPPTNTNAVTAPPAATNTLSQAPIPPAAVPPVGPTEYTIAKNDTFSDLAKKFHVSIKAIEDANPGVDPTKLRVGQKIQMPAPPAAAPTMLAAGDAAMAGAEQTYAVQSGDTLGAIAKSNGVSVKALREANNLKTDRITPGQKLKIPARTASAAGSGSGTNPAPPGH